MKTTYEIDGAKGWKARGLDSPDFEWDDGYGAYVVRCEDGTPVEIIGFDGGEPEDQTLGRDWSWVRPALQAAYDLGAARPVETPTPAPTTERVILHVGRSSSRCGACHLGCDPWEETHETVLAYVVPNPVGCHARFTHIQSDYIGTAMEEATRRMRPDLPYLSAGDSSSQPSAPERTNDADR